MATSRMVFYVDGAPALEKKETHHERNEKRVKALKTSRSLSRRPATATEADIDIAAECPPKDAVLSQISDFFAYDSVTTFWRPVGRRYEVKVLEYDREAVLAQIKLSATKLTALACVSSNDQNKNIPSMGIATNYSIIKDLTDTAQEIAVPAGISSVPLPSSHDAKPNRQGKHRGFRRHRVIDRPAHQPGVSQQVHRPWHSYKACPEPRQHEQPSSRKQYQRKPYTAEHETRYRQSIAEAKGKKANKKRQREAQ
ncbi:hypothetical protein EC957_006862 [Mortierella hygrophila]|uniref:Uncharacterized protein n=1 Tax=Mortierella hygrophila TaxID=979708 RepID=A0A9P6EZB9_9FUNG|nr:hypothetical protein EC957_006862 [Mortierella hygrophila]